MSIFSSNAEMLRISDIISRYLRLPFSVDSVPGAVMEGALAFVRGAEVRKTYEFVDVLDIPRRIGWQVKSTKSSTPVTWKRAKIPNADALIAASRAGDVGIKELGTAILTFCNNHARESIEKHKLSQIGYIRLIANIDGSYTYFERLLCTKDDPEIFDPAEFEWKWSKPKLTTKKEQLPAFHGIHLPTQRKWWAWHGLGENQLHFSGERSWWPDEGAPHALVNQRYDNNDKLTMEEFLRLLASSPFAN